MLRYLTQLYSASYENRGASEFSFMFGVGLLERLVKCEEMEFIGLVF